MTEPKTARNILWCDECHDLIQPGEAFYQAGGKIICSVCWGDP